MQISPYLNFNGNAAEASRFYADVLGGDLVALQKFGESPMAAQHPESADRVLHFDVQLGNFHLLGSDVAVGMSYAEPTSFMINLTLEDTAKAQAAYEALKIDGVVLMEFQSTFWAAGFAMLKDKFGIPWMINCNG